MSDDDLMVSVIVGFLLFIGYLILGSWVCSARWEKAGFETSWGPVQGCIVRTPSGRWVPDDRLRDTDMLAPLPNVDTPKANPK